MKTPIRNYFLFLMALGTITGGAWGQTTPIHIPSASDTSYYYPLPKMLFDRYTYIQAGTMVPMGKFGQLPDRTATVMDPFRNTTGTGAAMGYVFECGYRRAFVVKHAHSTRFHPFWGLAAGGAYNPLDWSDLGGNWDRHERTQFIQANGTIHLGIALKYRAHWVLEGYGGLTLPLVTYYPETRIGNTSGRPTTFSVTVVADSDQWAPGYTAGIVWRTRHFRIGAEIFRHQSTVSYKYWETDPGNARTYQGFFDWRALRPYIGVQF